MRGDRRHACAAALAILPLLALQLLLPSAAAASSHFDAVFASTGTTSLEGSSLAASASALSMMGPGTVTLEGEFHDVHMVNAPVEVIRINAPVGQPFSSSSQQPEEIGPELHLGQDLVLHFGVGDETRLLVTSGLEVLAKSPTSISFEGHGAHMAAGTMLSAVLHVNGQPTAPAPGYQLLQASTAMQATGQARLLVAGATVTSGLSSFATGHRLNASRSAIDPVTGSGRYVYDNWILQATTDDIAIDPNGPAVQIASLAASGEWRGTGFWHGVEGHGRYANSTLPDRQETLEVNGALAWHATPADGHEAWSISGEALYVNINTRGVGSAPATLGIAAGGVAALGALALGFRSLCTFILGRSTPKLLKARPLKSKARRQILLAIHAQQPVTLPELVRLTGTSRGALRYHLRILAGSDILQSVVPNGESGRNEAYMLNSSSLMFKTQGIATFLDQPKRELVAGRVLAHVNSSTVRKAVHDFLLRHGPAGYAAIRDHLVSQRLVASWPASTASYQLGELERAGAISSRWANRRKLYAANIDPSASRIQQYRNYFQGQGLLWLLEAFGENARLGFSVIVTKAAAQKPPLGRREILRRLQELVGLAVLQHDALDDSYLLEGHLQHVVPKVQGKPS